MKRKPPINYLIRLVITGKVKSADMMRPALLYMIHIRLNDFASVNVIPQKRKEAVAASPSSSDMGSQVCPTDHWSDCGNPAVMGFSIQLT